MSLTQQSKGVVSIGGQINTIRPAATWAELASIPRGPVYLRGYGVVDRDERLIARNWVPWELANDTSRWTLHTNIDATTFNPASLPAGWATAFTGTGECIVAGGEILVTSPPSSTASLTYTITGLGATDYVRVVVMAYTKSICDAVPTTYHRFGDSRRNNYADYHFCADSALTSTFVTTSVKMSTWVAMTAVDVRWAYGIGAAATSGFRVLSNPACASGLAYKNAWGGTSATDYVAFKSGSGAGAGPTVLAVDHLAIYTGQE